MVLNNLSEILLNQDYRLFKQIVINPQHCLNSKLILPSVISHDLGMRDCGHPYELPCC